MSPGVVDDDEDEAGCGFPRSTASSSTESGGRNCGSDAVSISPVFAPEDGCALALALGCLGCCPCLVGGSCANVLSNLQPAVCVLSVSWMWVSHFRLRQLTRWACPFK